MFIRIKYTKLYLFVCLSQYSKEGEEDDSTPQRQSLIIIHTNTEK